MRVCVPSAGNGGLADQVSEHFGRSTTFTVVDTETNAVEVYRNTSEHMGGTGKPPEQIAKTGAKVVVCSGLGPRAIDMLNSYGIQVYVGAMGTVSDAVSMWKAGNLELASDRTACKEHRH